MEFAIVRSLIKRRVGRIHLPTQSAVCGHALLRPPCQICQEPIEV